MRRSLPLLDQLEIQSPCRADWNQMTGDRRARHCAECRLTVHDLSEMTNAEAERLLETNAGGRVCVRFARRRNGAVRTKDSGIRLRWLPSGLRRLAFGVAALFAFLLPGTGCYMGAPVPTGRMMGRPSPKMCDERGPNDPPTQTRPAEPPASGNKMNQSQNEMTQP